MEREIICNISVLEYVLFCIEGVAKRLEMEEKYIKY